MHDHLSTCLRAKCRCRLKVKEIDAHVNSIVKIVLTCFRNIIILTFAEILIITYLNNI